MCITNRIAELLTQQKLTQKELARRSGITEAAISRYIKGDRVPRGVNLMKIADALGTTTDYLLSHDTFKGDDEKKLVKTLIARNASKMTSEERMELLRILLDNN